MKISLYFRYNPAVTAPSRPITSYFFHVRGLFPVLPLLTRHGFMKTPSVQDLDGPMINPERTLQKFVEQARHLHSLPAVALKVLELTSQPQVDLRALKECIETDPALTSKVLRVVNSSLFGLSREVSDLNQALTLLGIKPLKLLVLGFSLSESVFSKLTGKSMLRYWRHSLTKAVAAREIAETICHVPGDEPFIAALLQDIGKLVLLQELGEPYARLLNRPFATQLDLEEKEIEIIGFNNTELTLRLLAHWGLPESLLKAVSSSHAESEESLAPAATLAIAPILRLATLLADLLVDARYDLLATVLNSTDKNSRLTQAQLSQLVSSLQDKVAQLADVFSVELPAGLDYRDVLVQAHGRMSEVSAELTTELVKRNRPRAVPLCENAEMLDDVQALSAAVSKFINRNGGVPRSDLQPTAVIQRSLRTESRAASVIESLPQQASAAVHEMEGEGKTELMNLLSMNVYTCRQSRWALSLALVEIDGFSELVLKHGTRQASRLASLVHDACERIEVRQVRCVPLRQDFFGVILPNCDRHQAAKIGHELLQEILHSAPPSIAESAAPLTVSVGVASIDSLPKNFSPDTLMESATRCLSVARLSGGGTLKSIGIY